MRKKLALLLVIAVMLSTFFSGAPNAPFFVNAVNAATEQPNLVSNGGFESTTTITSTAWPNSIKPAGWNEWNATGDGKLFIDTNNKHSGNNSVRIEHGASSKRTAITSANKAQVTAGQTYLFGIWVKTEGVGNNSTYARVQFQDVNGVKINVTPNPIELPKLSGTNDWTLKEMFITPPAGTTQLTFEAFLENSAGTAWFDDAFVQKWDGLTQILLNQTSLSLQKGGSFQLAADLKPAAALDKSVVWTTSNSAIANVDNNGKVTATGVGTATITVMTPDGKVKAVCQVTVAAAIAVSEITLNKTSATLDVNETVTLQADVKPANVTDKSVVWTTSNSGVAVVDNNGNVTAKGYGKADITVMTPDGSVKAISAVTVQSLMPNGGFELTTTSSTWTNNMKPTGWGEWFASGSGKLSIDTSVKHSGSNSVRMDHDVSSRTSISNKAPATAGQTYSVGIWIKTENVGSNTAYMRIQYQDASGTKVPGSPTVELPRLSGTNDWTLQGMFVTPPAGTTQILMEAFLENSTGKAWFDDGFVRKWDSYTTITLPNATRLANINDYVTLQPNFQPANASNRSVVWKSSDETVAVVDSMGKVTAIGYGKTVISVMTPGGEVEAKCTVTVGPDLSLNQSSASLDTGDSIKLLAIFTPENTLDKSVVWTTSDSTIAIVDSNGNVTARGYGKAVITVKTPDGKLKAECTITVAPILANGGFESTAKTERNKWTDNIEPVGWSDWFPSGGGKLSIDTIDKHSGNNSVRIDHDVTGTTSINKKAFVTAGQTYNIGGWIKTENVGSNKAYMRIQYQDNRGVKVVGSQTIEMPRLSGTNDWTLRDIFVTPPAGTAQIIFEAFLENSTGKVWFDDVFFNKWDTFTELKFKTNSKTVTIDKEQSPTVTLELEDTAVNVSDRSLKWSSSNDKVAVVDNNGKVTGVSFGSATITVTTKYGKPEAKAQVSVVDAETKKQYDTMRLAYFQRLTGNDKYLEYKAYADNASSSDIRNEYTQYFEDMKSYATSLSNSAQQLMNSMTWSSSDHYLWEKPADRPKDVHLYESYKNLSKMALAYSSVGTAVYGDKRLKNAILDGLNVIRTYFYNEGIVHDGNWYNWVIGMPTTINDILVLMYDEMDPQAREAELTTVNHFSPSPVDRPYDPVNGVIKDVGSNLFEKAFIVSLAGVLGKNAAKIAEGRDSIAPELQFRLSGNGVYADGSIVQHNFAYSGTYGVNFITKPLKMNLLLAGTNFQVAASQYDLNEIALNSFDSLIYNGMIIDIVNGRAISRGYAQLPKDLSVGLLQMAEVAPAAQKLAMKQLVKEWINTDKVSSGMRYTNGLSIKDIALVAEFEKESVTPRGELIKHKVFAGMDRIVHSRPGYAFAISMFSDRNVSNEYGNKENTLGRNTGMGMTSLYNADFKQYIGNYWATVDYQRLPGMTTDGYFKPIARDWEAYYNSKTWVGGSSIDGLYGAAGMEFALDISTGSPLSGRKSWFSFDDEIVALGSDITAGKDGKQVETIVENRKLKSDGSNALYVNNANDPKPVNLGWSETMADVQWAHLEEHQAGAGSGIGYYFPVTASVYGKRETRTGTWSAINGTDNNALKTDNYLSLAFEHDQAHNSYAYVLLPGKNVAATESYSKNPHIDILSQTDTVHAVQERSLGITAANFWKAGTVSFITADKSASVMVKESNGELELAVSVPTQRQDRITIELTKPVSSVISKDATVQVIQTSPRVKVEINVRVSGGKTHTITFKSDPIPPADATLQASVTAQTYQDVAVTINYPADAAVKQYKVGESGSWLAYTAPVIVASNDTVYARGTNAEGLASRITSLTVSNIDKVVPTAAVAYNVTTVTNDNVVATITPNKPVTITNNGGSTTYTFTENGSFTFEFVDSFGNRGAATATVANIDRTQPTAAVAYSQTTPTFGSVIATIKPSKPGVTITNNGGSTSYTFTENGSFTFELVDAPGNPGTATATVNNITSKSTAKPGTIALSHDNGWDTGLQDGDYNVIMDVWSGNNGKIYKLYENGVLIDTKMVTDNSPNAQHVVTSITNKPNGTYKYVVELTNAFGTTRSNELTVSVTQASPGTPKLSDTAGWVNGLRDGFYTVKMSMDTGTNGNLYKLYENGVLIDTQTLTAKTPGAQSTVTTITYKPNGTYKYVAELSNALGLTKSNELTVTVTQAAPAKPQLSHDNWDQDGIFHVTMNMWSGTNGQTYNLYENGVLIYTQPLGFNTPAAQSAVAVITNRPQGTYQYRGELVNFAGATSSDTITVNVTK